MPRKVITVARQMGSEGDVIAQELGREMGIQILDRQILEAAAAAAGVSPETIGQAEKVPSFLERMLEYLGQHSAGLDPLSNVAVETATPLMLTSENYRHLIEEVIRRTAVESDAIIVRHGGAVVLRDVPYVLKVLICAPVSVRVQRVQELEHLSLQEAEHRVKDDDKTRLDYFQTYYKINWLNPALYDLSINTARIMTRDAVELILRAHERSILE